MMQKHLRPLISGSLIWFLVIAISLQAKAIASDEKPQTAPLGHSVEWTKIQDLRPDTRAANRPVKDKWAVVIGISDFQEKPLNNDLHMDLAARDFYNYLVDPAFGRFDKDHVKLLTNQEATRQNILASVGEHWLGQVVGPDDLVVVFIGTHGFPAGDGNTYICAFNSMLDNLYATGISMQSFMNTLKANVPSDRIVLILQACYSGAAELTYGAKALSKSFNIDPEKIMLGKGHVLLSSSRPDQITWGDVFSSNLTRALKKQDGLIPLNQAFTEARDRTEYDTTHDCVGCKPQTPVIKSDWKGNELVLGIPPVGKNRSVPQGAVNFLSAEAHYMLASKQAASGNLDEAIKEYKLALSVDPKYADAYSDLGSVLAIKNDWQDSAHEFEKAIALQPNDGLYHANYARTLAKLNRNHEADIELKRAYELNPNDRVVLTALADRALKAGETTEAIEYLDKAFVLYPKSATINDRLSYALAKGGNFSRALCHAEEAIKLDPQLVSARLNRASVLMLKGDKDEALRSYRDAVRISPVSADAHYLLSLALEQTHEKKEAYLELSKFIELSNPNDPRLEKAKSHLSELSAQ